MLTASSKPPSLAPRVLFLVGWNRVKRLQWKSIERDSNVVKPAKAPLHLTLRCSPQAGKFSRFISLYQLAADSTQSLQVGEIEQSFWKTTVQRDGTRTHTEADERWKRTQSSTHRQLNARRDEGKLSSTNQLQCLSYCLLPFLCNQIRSTIEY